MEMNRPIHRSNNSGMINQVQREELLSDEQKYLSILKEWEKNAPEDEDRIVIANQLRDCVAKGHIEFKLSCSDIEELPPLPPRVTSLVIVACHYFTTVSDDLSQLTKLRIEDCRDFETLPDNLSQLTELHINECRDFETLPDNLSQLTKLYIGECDDFETLPDNLSQLTELHINECENFTTLPDDLSQLTELKINACQRFTTVPDNLSQLTVLYIRNCLGFTTMPDDLDQLTVLTIARCNNFTTVPDNLSQLSNFKIHHCNNFTTMPDNLSQLTKLYIGECKNFTTMPGDLSELIKLNISNCLRFTKLPDNLSELTELKVDGCASFTALPIGLSQLATLYIHNCPNLTEFPHDLPANLMFSGNRFADPVDYVSIVLHVKCAYWTNDIQDINGFKEYFVDRMWDTEEAQGQPAAFKQKQLTLLQQMDNDPELRQACLDLALVGSADCHDNALAMFQKMQEKALDIAMHKPNLSMNLLISYGLALENKNKLERLIEGTPELKQAIYGGEGTEAMLALQLLCREKNIALPIPMVSMINEETGWEQFRRPEDLQADLTTIKNRISALLDHVIPPNAKPSANFLAAQPFWQAFLCSMDPTLSKKIDAIETTATEKQAIEDDKLFGGGTGNESHAEIEQNMKAIEQERLNAIAHLYLDETVRLLG